MKRVIFLLPAIFYCMLGRAQDLQDYLGDEKLLYAETKQVNQFFRRFNCEEDLYGKRLGEHDAMWHDPEFRKNYVKMLFDKSNVEMTDELKVKFAEDISDDTPKYLEFHGGEWFAEVRAKFIHKGKEEYVTIFLGLEEENGGSKWVITNVYFEPYTELFYNIDDPFNKFLHPMSHELDFMNLIKVFKDKDNVEYYFENEFKPDFTTIFLYEVKNGDMKFKTIENVRFHFFQVDGWYFELSEYNRNNGNSGWLISWLTEVAPDQKDILLKYIYYEY